MDPQLNDDDVGARITQRSAIAEQHAIDALLRWKVAESDTVRERLIRSKIGAWAAHCYPSADLSALLLIADWLVWLTALDDVTEAEGKSSLTTLIGRMVCVLENPDALTGGDGPFATSLAELSSRLDHQTAAAPWQRVRVVEAVRSAFLAMLWEANSEATNLADYLVMRRHGSFAYVCVALVELACHGELAEPDRCHPAVQRLTTAVCNVFSWSNDLYSHDWEQQNAGSPTLLPLLMREYDQSPAAATDVAHRMLERELDLLHKLETDLPVNSHPALPAYVDALLAFNSGVLDFYQKTERYLNRAQ